MAMGALEFELFLGVVVCAAILAMVVMPHLATKRPKGPSVSGYEPPHDAPADPLGNDLSSDQIAPHVDTGHPVRRMRAAWTPRQQRPNIADLTPEQIEQARQRIGGVGRYRAGG